MQEVSLYIPCFNAAGTIRLCLDGVFRQPYALKEVLVIDDGSTDETVAIASRYPVRIIRHETNRGLAAARNTAVRNIDAEFIASLDADCLPRDEWLVFLMKRFDSSKIAGVGGKLLEDSSKSVFDAWRSVHMKQYWEVKKRKPPFLFGSNTVFRKEALVKIGLYDEKFNCNYEDVDISTRLKKAKYSLIYEPKAVVLHLKSDNISSLLDSYWKWHLGYYQKKGYYATLDRLAFKIKDNIGLANRYLEEDIVSRKKQLIYLDFLLAIHHSLRDFEYFISQNMREKDNARCSSLSVGLNLLDLTFFYHFCSLQNNLSTLMPQKDAFLQNFLALNLLLGRFIRENFKNNNFRNVLYKHLFLSLYRLSNPYLLDKLSNLVELHCDWQDLEKKKHPNLNIIFLKNIFLTFQDWLHRVKSQHPDIIRLIENSAEITDRSAIL